MTVHRCREWIVQQRGFLFPEGLIHYDEPGAGSGWWWMDRLGQTRCDETTCPFCAVNLNLLLST